MSYMLEECPSLVSLDLSSFDTSSVTDMRSMFYNCSSLKMLDLSGFDTSKVMDMGVMFAHCSSLVSLDLSSFDTSSVTDMTCMFNSCSSLATLDLSGFETITVIDMNDMFSGCSSLTSLSLVSFDVSSVVDMSYMFYMCSSLDTLDLSGFDTTSVINMKEMFSDCPKLGEVKLGDKFDFRGAKTEPQTELPGEVWLSTSTGEMFTSLQIAEKRNRIADTYLLNGDGLISIANASIASIPSQLYTGAELRPEIAVTLGSAKLTEGRDYSVTYEGNVNAGTAKVTVTGMNGFVDTLVSTFEITPLSITSVELSQDSFTYDGSEKKPAVIVKSGDRILVEGPDYEVQWPADVTAAGVKAIGVTGKGNYAGNKEVSYEIAVFETRAMFRLYNPNSGEHFYTSSDIERDHLISLGWQDEGIGWTAPVSGDAVYRLYNSYAGEHHYTLSADERDMLVSVGWNDEGIGWYSDADRSVPLYRVYNPNEFANNHHYTTSEVERDFLLSIGWRDEGVGWHGVG